MNQAERYTATMIEDSVSPQGIRLPTIHVTMPRIILAEGNTHRAFTRNARSTRAVPTSKLIAEVRQNPFVPLKWLRNKPGMQASEPMTPGQIAVAEGMWLEGAREAADRAEHLFALGLHKQWAGRILEPFLFVDWLVSATDWANFMALRDDEGAQPEIELVAQRIRDCLDGSTPKLLKPGQWHLPYIREQDWDLIIAEARANTGELPSREKVLEYARMVSAARCARVSYKPFDGNASISSELDRYDRLMTSRPVHASPAEHQATPDEVFSISTLGTPQWMRPRLHGNFSGWVQHRKLIPFETITEMPARRA